MKVQFLRNNRFLFCFVAVLLFSSVMVLRQISAADTAHVKRREDFLLLQERGEAQALAKLYQELIQELPGLNDRLLSEDLQRTSMLVQREKAEPENLVWKYHVSVGNELKRRAERRLANRPEISAGK